MYSSGWFYIFYFLAFILLIFWFDFSWSVSLQILKIISQLLHLHNFKPAIICSFHAVRSWPVDYLSSAESAASHLLLVKLCRLLQYFNFDLNSLQIYNADFRNLNIVGDEILHFGKWWLWICVKGVQRSFQITLKLGILQPNCIFIMLQ
jgi:hypothetical protein